MGPLRAQLGAAPRPELLPLFLGKGSGLTSPPRRAICGILSCAYLFCQRTFLSFVKTNLVISKLLATR